MSGFMETPEAGALSPQYIAMKTCSVLSIIIGNLHLKFYFQVIKQHVTTLKSLLCHLYGESVPADRNAIYLGYINGYIRVAAVYQAQCFIYVLMLKS